MNRILYFVCLGIWLRLTTALPCDPNPCKNDGECLEDDSYNLGFSCICPKEYAGIYCDIPFPGIICGNKSIEILIDKQMVIEQNLTDNIELVHFQGSSNCRAVERNGQYHLKVDAPFTDCGMSMRYEESHGYIFKQQIVWNKMTENVERPLVLVDFQCNYTDRYSVFAGPLIPTVTTVDFDTSYGTFTVQMDLYKDQDFLPDSKHSTRPVIAIEDEVCVQQSLVNVDPEHLVLTLLRCWGSTNKDGSGLNHELISDRCSAEDTTTVLQNGESSEAQFCFQMFKWQDTMDSIYLHCFVNVCNATAFPEYCTCQEERKKRSILVMTEEKQRQESTVVSSEKIRIVQPARLQDWLSFLENPSETTYQENTVEDYVIDPDVDRSEDRGPDNTVLIAVGVVLVIAIIILGVVVGVYINFRRTNTNKSPKLKLPQASPPEHRGMMMPIA